MKKEEHELRLIENVEMIKRWTTLTSLVGEGYVYDKLRDKRLYLN